MHFFDIQNPHGILDGEKPVVIDMGPYAFNEYFVKFDIKWYDDGDTVEYNTYRYYIFNQERTGPGLSIEDQLTVIYPTTVALEYMIAGIPYNASVLLEEYILGALDQKYNDIEAQLKSAEAKLKLMPRKKALYNELLAMDAQVTAFYNVSRSGPSLSELL